MRRIGHTGRTVAAATLACLFFVAPKLPSEAATAVSALRAESPTAVEFVVTVHDGNAFVSLTSSDRSFLESEGGSPDEAESFLSSVAGRFAASCMPPDGGLTAHGIYRSLLGLFETAKKDAESGGVGVAWGEFDTKTIVEEELGVVTARLAADVVSVDAFFEREAFLRAGAEKLRRSMESWRLENAEPNARRYATAVWDAHREYDVDPYLIAAILCAESEGRERAVSKAGAVGLMQIHAPVHMKWIPDWFEEVRTEEDLFVPENNIRIGTSIFAANLRRAREDVSKALYAYRGGKSRSYADKILRTAEKIRRDAKRCAGEIETETPEMRDATFPENG